jgi:adenylate cyclase
VLPFQNMSPDPLDEYFADGMTEELISTMSKIEQFEVISRTSVMQFKKNPKPIKEVSRELEAGTVLEGSVRKSGDTLRVTVQMIDAARDRHTWSESYDTEVKDAFSIQSQISKAVAEELRVRIDPGDKARLEKKPTSSTEAYTLFLKGRYNLNLRTREGFRKAIDYFTEATRKDPDFARAYAALADCYVIQENWGYIKPEEAFAKYRTYTTKALELDESLADAHVSLAAILASKEWNVREAEREILRAIQLDPNSSTAHQRYGFSILGPQGRHEEAMSELTKAARLDPLTPIVSANIGDELQRTGHHAEAEEQYRSVLKDAPRFAYAHARLGLTLLKESKYEEAIDELQKSVQLSEDDTGLLPDLIYAYWTAGRKDDAERSLEKLELKSKQEFVSSVTLAKANASVGRNDRAIEQLRRAIDERSSQLRPNMNEPQFEQLRSDPRFQSMLVKVGVKNLG